ncbi:MAG: hypothetical protein Dbin4_00410 [Alphaproteobacteria bacterium]|nr:hypothetical protein [Alphaproteobacteria bacterium]
MIPTVNLDNDGSFVRVIAGDFNEVKGPAKTFTPINLWDVRLRTGYSIDLDVPSGFNTLLLVLNGAHHC